MNDNLSIVLIIGCIKLDQATDELTSGYKLRCLWRSSAIHLNASSPGLAQVSAQIQTKLPAYPPSFLQSDRAEKHKSILKLIALAPRNKNGESNSSSGGVLFLFFKRKMSAVSSSLTVTEVSENYIVDQFGSLRFKLFVLNYL